MTFKVPKIHEFNLFKKYDRFKFLVEMNISLYSNVTGLHFYLYHEDGKWTTTLENNIDLHEEVLNYPLHNVNPNFGFHCIHDIKKNKVRLLDAKSKSGIKAAPIMLQSVSQFTGIKLVKQYDIVEMAKFVNIVRNFPDKNYGIIVVLQDDTYVRAYTHDILSTFNELEQENIAIVDKKGLKDFLTGTGLKDHTE